MSDDRVEETDTRDDGEMKERRNGRQEEDGEGKERWKGRNVGVMEERWSDTVRWRC